MMAPETFGSCPACGVTGADFNPESVEVIPGAAGINLTTGPAGFAADWDGQTDVSWDSTMTVAYRCGRCCARLPESHQAYLDQLLNQVRLQPPTLDQL